MKTNLVIVNKLTYLYLLSIPIGIGKIIFDFHNDMNIEEPLLGQFIQDTFVSLMIIIIGIILFYKSNTHSQWMNPNHPKSK